MELTDRPDRHQYRRLPARRRRTPRRATCSISAIAASARSRPASTRARDAASRATAQAWTRSASTTANSSPRRRARRPSRLGAELFAEIWRAIPTWRRCSAATTTLPSARSSNATAAASRVPDEISIIGFNDLEFCASAFPSLTFGRHPALRDGGGAANIVLDLIRGTGERPRERRIDLGFRVVARESTGRRRTARRAAAGRTAAALLPDGS